MRNQDAEIRELQAKLNELTSQMATLRSTLGEPASKSLEEGVAGKPPENGRKISRAGLLAAGAAGISGVIGAAVAGPLTAQTALAATDTNYVASGGSGTSFSNGTGYSTGANVSGTSYGVFALSSSGIGLFGSSGTYIGIYGSSAGGNAGVFGYGAGYWAA